MLSLIAAALLSAAPAEDTANFYEISTAGSSPQVKAGEKGKLVLEIKSKNGAHISDEAPLKIDLKATQVKLEKDKLALADSVAKKADGQQYADPKFEVPFSGATAGKGEVEAKLTFFVCTDKQCARQSKTVKVPVDVN